MQHYTPITATPDTRTTPAEADPFEHRFGSTHRLPKGLRKEARGMSWPLFTATYCPTPDLRITGLTSEKLRAGKARFSAELTTYSKTAAPTSTRRETIATGPASAITHFLAEEGRYVEIRTFRQQRIFEATVTFLEVAHQWDHTRTAWAVGFGPTDATSIAHALASGAQRIHG
ncbi:acetyl-CoA acetyltransferase [Corynebacterium yudongzhengii]|uniref:Acetyl-CoA acetyltransferase n=1 Tax=Corynebacterium yudongzhengii TaxID=2080740 RepID=A0A2U1T5X6_9CORY|nr:acetyl-CoA acetyltransferase [Corynebacterium yudongzhengii]AWB82659.1 acetyl-CoA acetyltransferase [Corynebacterium yudongzhengii]PWC01375.1 acetyl-CoA acetyltransferase [Corynebacterium yudongzhengii]